MNKLKSLGLAAVMAGAALASAFAADTSATIVARKAVKPVGSAPQVGYVHATVTSGGVSAGAMSYDLPAPRGSGNIIGCLTVVQSVSGSTKPITTQRNGATIYVSNSALYASGTLATGDVAKSICVYQ